MKVFSRAVALAANLFALPAMFLPAPAAWSAQFYVSATASPQGDGSIGNPWPMKVALAHPGVVNAGDTIWLRGGLYWGRFSSALSGNPGNPIVVRSYPGEWARIDGFAHVSLVTAITPNDTKIQVSDTSAIRLGAVLKINNEGIYVKGINGSMLTVVRGWGGAAPGSYPAGSLFGFTDTIFTIGGTYTNYMGFEVMSSDPVRTTLLAGSAPSDITRGDGINVHGPGIKLINLVVHDTGDGFFLGEQALDLEVSGCISYSNGWQGADRGHGHGLYIQNLTGIKKISDVISFNNFATGMKVFGRAASAVGVDFFGIVSFNNGSMRAPGFGRGTNLYAGTDSLPADLISVNDSYFFHTPGAGGENLHFGFSSPSNDRLTVKNNRSYGGNIPMDVSLWRNTTVTGNTFYISSSGSWSSQMLVNFRTSSSSPIVNWGQNQYFNAAPAFTNGVQYSMGFNTVKNSLGGGRLSFPEWKAACNCDSSSQYTASAPTGVEIYVRPNAYEAGRANIVVFNWSGVPAVSVDLSGKLNIGDSYEIMDAQNYFAAPLGSGVFTGAPVSIPMTLSVVSAPSGTVPTPPVHTAPMMGTFVLRKTISTGASVSVTPTSVSLNQLQSQQFTAQVTGAANTSVTWSMSPATGTLFPSGLYAAQNTIGAASTVTVKATSVADPTRFATAVVTLTPPGAVSVALSPAIVSLAGGTSQQFAAQVTGSTNTAVTWSMSPATGSLSTAGRYTAPNPITAASTVTVKATSVADPTKFATAVVTLTAPVTVSVVVSPASVSLTGGTSQQFAAQVTGAANSAVTWSMSPATGSLSTTGRYTAPASISAASTVTVKAASVANPAKFAIAVVTLTPTVTISIAVSPASASLIAGMSKPFTAQVTGSTNQAVTWSLSPAIGTISAAGNYAAPASLSAVATVTVTATSVADPTRKATALIYLNLNNPAIAISPITAIVRSRKTFQFSSTTLGLASPAVVWSVVTVGGGTITQSGLYTAPAVTANKNVIVRVTSPIYTTKFAQATVTVTP